MWTSRFAAPSRGSVAVVRLLQVFACLLLLTPPAAHAQVDGTYRIMTIGNMRIWHEDARPSQKINSSGQNDDDNGRFILEKQRDGNFRIKVKGTDLYLHEDGGGDKLLSTRYQPADVFTQFQFVPQEDLSFRIKCVGSNRFLRDVPTAEGGTLSTADETDDQFSRFMLLAPNVHPHDKKKITFKNSTPAQVEVFRITRSNEVVQHGIIIEPGRNSEQQLNVGFRWIVRDTGTRAELVRFLTTDKTDLLVNITARAPTPTPTPTPMPLPKEDNNSTMPNLVSLFKVDAEIALQRAGLSFQAIAGNTTTDDRELGRVYAQSVPASSTVNPGQQITFHYYRLAPSTGVDQVRVPWVSNMSRWDAERRLLRHGFLPRAVSSSKTDRVQRFDIVKGDAYDFANNKFRSTQSPKGHQGYGAGQSLAPFGSEVTYEYEFGENQTEIGPYDADSANPVPNLIPLVNADDSLEIAWTRRDGRNYYSRFSGPNWAEAEHQTLTKALRFLGGLARDEAGNTYLATTRMEYLFGDQETGVHRPNVAHVLRRNANQPSFEFFLDLNKQGFSPAIFNPQNMDSALFHPSRLAYGKGELAFAFGQNHGGGHTTSNIIGVGTDGTSKYSGGGGQHTADVRVIFDGADFVMAQAFEAGVGLSKLSRNGDKRTWSQHILVFKNEWRNRNGDGDSFIRLGGIAPVNDGYLLVLSHGRGGGPNYDPRNWSLRDDAPLYTLKAPRNFETLQKFDWVQPGTKVPDLPGNFNQSVLLSPPVDCAFIRPTMVDMQNGKYLVLAEQWNWRNPKFEGTFGVVMNVNGQRLSEVKSLGMVRLQASNDAFYLPKSRKAAWVSGDTVNNRLNLYTVDENLNLQSFTLGL